MDKSEFSTPHAFIYCYGDYYKDSVFVILFPILAEFIIMLGETNSTLEKFKAALEKNGAEFPVSMDVLHVSPQQVQVTVQVESNSKMQEAKFQNACPLIFLSLNRTTSITR